MYYIHAGRTRLAKVEDAARRWRLQVVRSGPWRARGLQEAVEALELAEVLRRCRHASGAWSMAQRAHKLQASDSSGGAGDAAGTSQGRGGRRRKERH